MQTPTREPESNAKRIAAASSPAAATPAKPTALQALLEAVRRDSLLDPHAYLEETEVPHGGE